MLRTSSYTIYVDLPGNEEELLLVHGYTGAYDKVSRRVATYVRSLSPRRPSKPLYGDWSPEPDVAGQASLPSDSTIEVLKHRGYLTEMSLDEEESLFEKLAGKLHESQLRGVPQYILMPTYNCNLRCSYCFQDYMRTDNRFGHLLHTIQPKIIDRIFDAMPQIEAMHGLDAEKVVHRRIGFFGGEPLLENSFSVIKYIVEKAHAGGTADFWAVTNGTDLRKYQDLLAPDKISWLQITLDGTQEEHDRRRIYADGGGSYVRIAQNISWVMELGVRVSVRLNIDRNNINHLPQLAEDFRARGWDKNPRFSAYTAPIHASNANTAADSTFDTWELDQALLKMVDSFPEISIINRPDTHMKNQARGILGKPTTAMPNFRESFCSAHTRMYIFDSFADIYACWERTGDPSIRIGHLEEDGSVRLNVPVNALWKSRTVASNPVCRKCSYALHCGGGCAVLAEGKTGQFHSNFCDGFASRFRSTVAEAYLEHVNGVDLQEIIDRVCDQ